MRLAIITLAKVSANIWLKCLWCLSNNRVGRGYFGGPTFALDEASSIETRICRIYHDLIAKPRSCQVLINGLGDTCICDYHAHPTDHHVETCTDRTECAKSECNVFPNPGTRMITRTVWPQPVDFCYYCGNICRSCRSYVSPCKTVPLTQIREFDLHFGTSIPSVRRVELCVPNAQHEAKNPSCVRCTAVVPCWITMYALYISCP